MKCPVDSIDLIMSERSGVEIDYCPQCRGVWLDRGELDKIIDRAAESLGPAAGVPAAPLPPAAMPPAAFSPAEFSPASFSPAAAATFRRRCTTSTRAGTTGVRMTAAMTSAGTMTAATVRVPTSPGMSSRVTMTAAVRRRRKAGWGTCSTSSPAGSPAVPVARSRRGPRGAQSPSSAMNSRACFMEISEWRVRAVAAASVSPLLARVRILP